MSSNVVVVYNQRRITIKTTPGKPLSDIRTEACTKFGLSPPSSFILKRGGAKLDLSLPVRLTNIVAGTKLDLARTSPTASSKPVSVVLRTVDPVEQLSDTFPSTASVWDILRKFEQDARAAGRNNVNITERYAPSSAAGSGRLLYQMPAVRVANRELASIEELRKTLGELGCNGRELLVLRFLPTEIPYEDALMEIAGITKEEAPTEEATGRNATAEVTEQTAKGVTKEDVVMSEAPEVQDTVQSTSPPVASEAPIIASSSSSPETSAPAAPAGPVEPKIAVYQPPLSAIPAAATFEVPDSAYEIGIAELKKIKENYHNAGLPQRLLSDKELAEKEVVRIQAMEKIDTLKIKVRFPDGYISQQELEGKATARDLYTMVRGTLRYPDEPFVLMIPPRDAIKDDGRRLTVDLKLRTNASLHLLWSKEASDKAKNELALKEELVKASKELPKPMLMAESDAADTGKDTSGKGKGKGREGNIKGDIEKKLKGFMRLGKK